MSRTQPTLQQRGSITTTSLGGGASSMQLEAGGAGAGGAPPEMHAKTLHALQPPGSKESLGGARPARPAGSTGSLRAPVYAGGAKGGVGDSAAGKVAGRSAAPGMQQQEYSSASQVGGLSSLGRHSSSGVGGGGGGARALGSGPNLSAAVGVPTPGTGGGQGGMRSPQTSAGGGPTAADGVMYSRSGALSPSGYPRGQASHLVASTGQASGYSAQQPGLGRPVAGSTASGSAVGSAAGGTGACSPGLAPPQARLGGSPMAPGQQMVRPGQATMGARVVGGAQPYMPGGQLRPQAPQNLGYRGLHMGPSPRGA